MEPQARALRVITERRELHDHAEPVPVSHPGPSTHERPHHLPVGLSPSPSGVSSRSRRERLTLRRHTGVSWRWTVRASCRRSASAAGDRWPTLFSGAAQSPSRAVATGSRRAAPHAQNLRGELLDLQWTPSTNSPRSTASRRSPTPGYSQSDRVVTVPSEWTATMLSPPSAPKLQPPPASSASSPGREAQSHGREARRSGRPAEPSRCRQAESAAKLDGVGDIGENHEQAPPGLTEQLSPLGPGRARLRHRIPNIFCDPRHISPRPIGNGFGSKPGDQRSRSCGPDVQLLPEALRRDRPLVQLAVTRICPTGTHKQIIRLLPVFGSDSNLTGRRFARHIGPDAERRRRSVLLAGCDRADRVEQTGTDLRPTDQQERSHGVERGLPEVPRDQWTGHVQRERQHARKHQQTPSRTHVLRVPSAQGDVPRAQQQGHHRQIDRRGDQRCHPDRHPEPQRE